MRIDIHVSQFELTEALRDHTEKRIKFALSWAQQHLRKVSVRLSDINGPRGGADKSCRIQIPVAGSKDIVIEDIEADLYVAIDRAIDRAARVVGRKLNRQREHKHNRIAVIDTFVGDAG